MIKEGFVICENTFKEGFLNGIEGFNDYTFLTLNELLKKLLFDVKKEGIVKVSLKYNIKPEIAKEYISYLKYIELFYDNSKLNYLKEIYNYLLNENMIIFDNGYKNYLKSRPISILGYIRSKEIDYVLNLLDKNGYKYDYIENKDNDVISRNVYEFDDIVDESRFVFDSIKRLLDSGVSIHNIKIANYSSDYDFIFHRLESFYKIPINFDSDKNIISLNICRYICDNINDFNDYYELIDMLKKKYGGSIYLKKIINIINSYHLYNYKPSETKDVLVMELKNARFDKVIYEDGIELVDLGSPSIKKDDYVFVIGFNQKYIPFIYDDSGYLDDNILGKMGLDTSYDKNVLGERVVINNLNLDINYCISYKLKSPFDSYLVSSLVSKMGYKIIDGDLSYGVNENEDSIIVGNRLDQYFKYGVMDNDNICDVGYLTYDNKFNGISDENLKKYLPEVINLSYSTISNYAKCGFRYLMSSILYLDKFESGIDALIGVYCHRVLELCYKHDDYDFIKNIAINELLRDKELSHKERFFIDSMDTILSSVIEFNKEHEKNINDVKNEFKIEIKYDNDKLVFKGFVDKVLIENGESTYITIVDYKTGGDVPSLDNIEYGFNLQLPIYLFMIKKSNEFKNPIITGFYLQKIGPKDYPNFKLYGFTNSDLNVIKHIDDFNDTSSYIRGLRKKKDGSLYSSCKVISDSEMDKLSLLVEEIMLNVYSNIREGKFEINPKVDGKDNLGCAYCKFKDVCFVDENDKVKIKHSSFLKGE